MIKRTAEEYSKYLNLGIDEKLNGVNQIVDEMLTRLEEFETLIVLVQQERCNAAGITGHLSQTTESLNEIKQLCSKVDVLEKMVQDVDATISTLESKVTAAEEQFGLTDNSSKIKNFLMPLFKKNIKPINVQINESSVDFEADNYFTTENEISS